MDYKAKVVVTLNITNCQRLDYAKDLIKEWRGGTNKTRWKYGDGVVGSIYGTSGNIVPRYFKLDSIEEVKANE